MGRVNKPINFLELISGFRRGALLRIADAQLTDLVKAVRETGDKGEIVIKLPFKLDKTGQLECAPKVTSTIPRPSPGKGVYFVTEENELVRDDPRQLDFEDELEERRSRDVN